MSIIESIIYGFVSGITEFLPISSRAHQTILRFLFGVESRNFFQEFLVHIGLLVAVIFCCRDILNRFRHQVSASLTTRSKRNRKKEFAEYYDFRLLKTATFPLVICLLILFLIVKIEVNLLLIIGFLLINAILLFFAAHSMQGNRNAKTMTGLDGVIMGIIGSFSLFPGISRIGIISTYTTLRGADIKNTANWTVLLSIPAILCFIAFDLIGMVSVGAGTISLLAIISYVLSGIAAFCGGYIAISILFTILTHSGYAYFAYYSIGAALFTFIIYLIT